MAEMEELQWQSQVEGVTVAEMLMLVEVVRVRVVDWMVALT
ncbi:hypothetical protein Hdeb2414_s0001g00036751 [Helianthus debilis subsp. tardiflorus]